MERDASGRAPWSAISDREASASRGFGHGEEPRIRSRGALRRTTTWTEGVRASCRGVFGHGGFLCRKGANRRSAREWVPLEDADPLPALSPLRGARGKGGDARGLENEESESAPGPHLSPADRAPLGRWRCARSCLRACRRVAKSAMIDGVAVSKPTTSSMPPSFGSAMREAVRHHADHHQLCADALFWRYARSAWAGWMSPAQVSLSVYTQNTSTGTLFSAAHSIGSAQSVPPNGRSSVA